MRKKFFIFVSIVGIVLVIITLKKNLTTKRNIKAPVFLKMNTVEGLCAESPLCSIETVIYEDGFYTNTSNGHKTKEGYISANTIQNVKDTFNQTNTEGLTNTKNSTKCGESEVPAPLYEIHTQDNIFEFSGCAFFDEKNYSLRDVINSMTREIDR